MATENDETIRRMIEAYNAGGIPAARPFFSDEIEFHEPPEQPAPRVARGIDAVVELFGEFDANWEAHVSEPEEILPLGEGQFLVFSVERFTGRDGIELDAPAGNLFAFKDGKVVSWKAFWDRERARDAAGLSS